MNGRGGKRDSRGGRPGGGRKDEQPPPRGPRKPRPAGEVHPPRAVRADGGPAPVASRPPVPRKAVRDPAPAEAARPVAGTHGTEALADGREVRLHGVNACQAFFRHRRDRIIRAWFSETTGRRHFSPLMKWLAAQRLGYHLVTDAELEKITGSTHHEGVCLLVRATLPRAAGDWLQAHRDVRRGCVVALEGVGNPHNLGGILRTCAHFGIAAVVVPDARSLAGGAAVRTAEGGAEFVDVLDAPAFADTVRAFRAAGWRVVTTTSHAGQDLYRSPLPEKCLLLFGEEGGGLSAATLAGGDLCVRVPGTGKVESLNVSVTAGVLLGEWWRQHAG